MTRAHSNLLNEDFTVKPDGSCVFASGVIYTAAEISILKRLGKDTVKAVHKAKQELGGEVEEVRKRADVWG
jgi:hypothetical protein